MRKEPNMAAYVEHHFLKGFLLDEEKLRKLVNIINQRLSRSTPPISHKFRVFRADSYSYETDNVEDIINEDNTDWRKITKLQIKALSEKEFEFDLTFSNDGTDIKINGDLMTDLADSYFTDRICPGWFRPGTERLDFLIKLAKDYKVAGVIWYQLLLLNEPNENEPGDKPNDTGSVSNFFILARVLGEDNMLVSPEIPVGNLGEESPIEFGAIENLLPRLV